MVTSWLVEVVQAQRMFLLVCLLVCQVVFWFFLGFSVPLTFGEKEQVVILVSVTLIPNYLEPIYSPTDQAYTPKPLTHHPPPSSLLELCVTVAHWEVEMRLVNND